VLKMRALEHPNDDIRKAAAAALLWDEPVVAEEALMRASVDAVDSVAKEALATLAYYASRHLLRSMDDLRRDGRESLREAYDNTFCWVQEEFAYGVTKSWESELSKRRFEAWLEPVRDLLPVARDMGDCEENRFDEGEQHERVTLASIVEDFSDADGAWCDKKNRWSGFVWMRVDEAERAAAAEFLSGHEDPEVRQMACWAAGQWKMTDKLVALLDDWAMLVRKSAALFTAGDA
jgi:hypothetical protein